MREIQNLEEIVTGKAGVLCDLWGVLHNGKMAFQGALRALEGLRHNKIPVILLSNSPKPARIVAGQISKFGIDPRLFRAIVSSGQLVRGFLSKNPGKTFFFIGWERDRVIYEGLPNPLTDDLRAADFLLCTGFFEGWGEDPAQYEPFFSAAVEAKIPLVCANPDLEVFIGEKKVLCAGTLAKIYRDLGGEALLFGKPEPLAYETCFEILGEDVEKNDLLVIGDNLETDILGARRQGIQSLFITQGLHGKPASGNASLEPLFKTFDIQPDYFMPELDW